MPGQPNLVLREASLRPDEQVQALNMPQKPQYIPEASATFFLPKRDPAKARTVSASKETSERNRIVDRGNDGPAALFRGLTGDRSPPL
jgi:hypothetical protein